MRLDARAWEKSLSEQLAGHFLSPKGGPDRGYDLTSSDGRVVVAVKSSLLGTRDLAGALMQLAHYAAEQPQVEHAVLMARFPRMRAERLRAAWAQVTNLLRPRVAERLAVVGLSSDGLVSLPEAANALQPLAEALLAAERTSSPSTPLSEQSAAPLHWTPRTFDVWCVLVDAWAHAQGSLPIQELERRSGVSYPTVIHTLDRLTRYGEVERGSGRSAQMRVFPRRSLGEIAGLADSLRHTQNYVDGSGRNAEPAALLDRLERRAPVSVALGGVVAARRLDHDFDLHGIPRIDVTVRSENSLAWIQEVEPALRPARASDGAPLLVVHRSRRAEPAFEPAGSSRLPTVGPAETLLDLYELRLTEQAEDLARRLITQKGLHG